MIDDFQYHKKLDDNMIDDFQYHNKLNVAGVESIWIMCILE